MGHHGVSVGDADGDGLDDLYVSQPSGLPNRLFRNNGDGTFEDVTEAAGLAVLDRTSQSLFADVDNDGDQDLVLVTRTGPLLFVNDGKGRFTRDPDAFQLQRAAAGLADLGGAWPTTTATASWTSISAPTGYFIGASEDKAGPPSPYHDAQNGPPNVLLRNDGHGRFVDVTEAVGLDENNDRFSFAAGWADYDEDGWPDLLVANDFGRKNLYRNEGLVERAGALQGRGGAGRRRGLRRRHERGVPGLRQRRAPRHLHRQHVDGGRTARDGRSRASCPTRRRRSARSIGGTPAATRSSGTAATARSRT